MYWVIDVLIKFLKHYALLLLFVLSISSALSQNQYVSFEHISIEEGLSHSKVQCILQDRTGYIWFGTYDGLNRYNGYTMDIYKSDSKDTCSLRDNNIYAMLNDQDGTLWVGTKYGGLSRFNEQTETFQTWMHDPNDPRSLGNDWVVSLHQDQEETLWLGTGNGLTRVIKEVPTEGTSQLSFDTYGDDEHMPLKIYKIDQFEDETLWLSTSKGLVTFDLQTKSLQYYNGDPNKNDQRDFKDVTAGVISWWDNRSLVGTDNGLFIKSMDNKSSHFSPYFDKKSNMINAQVNTMIKDHMNQVWVGTNSGLFLISPEGSSSTRISHNYTDAVGLSRNHVQTIYEDKQHIIWVGTVDGGVNKYDPNKFKFKRTIPYINESDNQQIRSFKSAYQTKDSFIWIGTDYGLHQFHKTAGTFNHLQTIASNESEEKSLSNGGATAILETKDGSLFIGHWGSGLDKIDPSSQIIRYPFDINESLTSNDGISCCIMSMKMDQDEYLWMASIYGFLQKFQPTTGTFDSYKIGEWIWDIEIDTIHHKVWCATENGFCSLDMKTHEVKCYYSDTESQGSISHNRTWSVFTDQEGRLWVSTYNGIERFDPKTEQFQLFTDQEISDFNVFSINQDDQGYFWLGTQRGISKFDLSDSSFIHFTAADGVFPDPHWSYKDREGLMYFGGVNGLNVFEPSEIMINEQKPTLVFTDFRLFNKSVEPSSSGPISQPINKAKVINLNYSQNVFSLDFAALNYTSSEKNHYAYRLVGFSEDWTYVGNDRTVSYTNLNPGNYVLQVKGSNNDKVWNEKGASIQINIYPPFWNTWWFRTIFILFVFGAIVLWIKLRIRIIKQKKKELKQLVVTRTSELQKANQVLEEQTAEISTKNKDLEAMAKEIETSSQMKLNFFTNISHELRTPLSLILGPLEKLIAEFKESNKYSMTLRMMHTNSMRLLKLINQLLDLSKLDGGFMHMQISHGDLSKFVHEIYTSFKFIADKKDIRYSFENKLEGTTAYFDADKIEKILFNVISNAFKFTESGGEISVHLTGDFSTNDHLMNACISVKDTGSGIDAEDIGKIFERFEKGKVRESISYLPGKGIGLSLAKSLAELHRGKIEVRSEVGVGTQFDIVLDVSGEGYSKNEILPYQLDTDHYVSEIAQEHVIYQEDDWEESEIEPFDPSLPYVLIAEDNYELRTFTALELSGYFNILQTDNGENALNLCIKHQPDIVLSDVMMPKMDGNELCKRIKSDQRTSHIIVVLLTAKANNIDQLKGLEVGADDYIMKPFNMQLLKLKVKNLLDTRHKMQEKYQSFGIIPKLTTNDTRDEELIQKAVSIVEANLDNTRLDSALISKEIGLSRSLLFTKIKSLTGMSLGEFVKDIRLKKAAHLLTIHDHVSISELSIQVGFANHSHFTRSFKEKFGQSPSDYLLAHTAP